MIVSLRGAFEQPSQQEIKASAMSDGSDDTIQALSVLAGVSRWRKRGKSSVNLPLSRSCIGESQNFPLSQNTRR
jgi:hypothetical protein